MNESKKDLLSQELLPNIAEFEENLSIFLKSVLLRESWYIFNGL